MSDASTRADNSIVTHTDGSQHLWRKRGACALCQGVPAEPKEPPPPAAGERIEDIIDPEDVTFEPLTNENTVVAGYTIRGQYFPAGFLDGKADLES